MSGQDEFLNIDTPENVVFGYEIVGIGSRFLAAIIDSVILVIVYGIVILATVFILGNFADPDTIFGSFVVGIVGLVGFFFIWGYYIFFELYWNGRSPGKQIVGLRVVRNDGTPITLSESVIRNLIRLIDFLPFAYGVGIVTMFIDGNSRRLGDMAGSTLVVRDSEAVTLDSLEEESAQKATQMANAPSGAYDELVATWPIDRLSDRDLQIAEDLLRRRDELSNTLQLATQVYDLLTNKMDVSQTAVPTQPHDRMQILAAIVKRRQTEST